MKKEGRKERAKKCRSAGRKAEEERREGGKEGKEWKERIRKEGRKLATS